MVALKRSSASDPVPTEEIFGPVHDFPGLPASIISYGLPFDKAVAKHIGPDKRVFVLASKSLAAKTPHLDRLQSALGPRLAGVHIGITSHTLFQECLALAAEARAARPDVILTLGAGSLTDAAKFVRVALAHEFNTVDDLAALNIGIEELSTPQHKTSKPWDTELIFIPTSLSAGEHTPYAGVTDGETGRKYQIYTGPAALIILDPWLALDTPRDIWLQSGVRGVDHAVEHGAQTRGADPAVLDHTLDVCQRALRLLVPGLLLARADEGATDVRARLNAQLGVALAIAPLTWGVAAGASHAIGHMLGPMGVGHGETSCILLPAVCAHNRAVNGERQAALAETLWEEPACEAVFEQRGLGRGVDGGGAELPDLLDAVIRELGMPRSLREKGIEGEEKLRDLARMSLHDIFVKTNPVPLVDEEAVMKILRMAA